MSSYVADDFAGINRRMQELSTVIDEAEEDCAKCDGAGWMQIYSPRPPNYTICDRCFNPKGRHSP